MDANIRTNGSELRDMVGLLTGMLIGWLAGFGALLLLAPQSGKRTRAQIMQKSMELQGWAADTFDDLVTLSQFDNRIILAGPREIAEDR